MSMQGRGVAVPRETTTLADLLDRVLDKGLVVAGDISVSLANVELLTIRIRLPAHPTPGGAHRRC